MINPEEILFYEFIKDSCKVVFDVGCREDIDYVTLSEGKHFHMFEPNPVFFNKMVEKLIDNDYKNIVGVNMFGLSNHTGDGKYYEDAQSFFKREIGFQSKSTAISYKLKSFSDYVFENRVDHIDFLKIDTEGGEPDILMYNQSYICNSVTFIQFEYANTWLDRGDGANLQKVFNAYERFFNFYFLKNGNHPIAIFCPTLLSAISEVKEIDLIDNFMKNGFGFEIIMVRKDGV